MFKNFVYKEFQNSSWKNWKNLIFFFNILLWKISGIDRNKEDGMMNLHHPVSIVTHNQSSSFICLKKIPSECTFKCTCFEKYTTANTIIFLKDDIDSLISYSIQTVVKILPLFHDWKQVISNSLIESRRGLLFLSSLEHFLLSRRIE